MIIIALGATIFSIDLLAFYVQGLNKKLQHNRILLAPLLIPKVFLPNVLFIQQHILYYIGPV